MAGPAGGKPSTVPAVKALGVKAPKPVAKRPNVVKFQQSHHLPTTGHYDSRTRAALTKAHAAPKAPKANAPKPGKPQQDPLVAQVEQQVRGDYAPQFADIGTQIAQAGQQQSNISSWFQAYRQQLAQAQQQSAAQYQGVQGQLSSLSSQGQQADNQANQQLVGQMQQSAQQRGGSVDPGTALVGNQASASRASQVNAALANVGTQGANEGAFLGKSVANATGQEAQAHTLWAGKQQALQAQRVALRQKEIGATTSGVQTARDNQLKNAIAEGSLGVKQQSVSDQFALGQQRNQVSSQNNVRTTSTSRANNANTNATSRSNNANTNATSRSNAQLRAQNSKKGATGKHAFTPTQVRGNQTKLRQLVGQLSQARRVHVTWTPQQFIDQAIKKKVDPLLASAAVESVFYGGVTAPTQARLAKAYGFRAKLGHKSASQNAGQVVRNLGL